MPSIAVGAFADEEAPDNDGQDDDISDTVAIVFSVLLLMAITGNSLVLDNYWFRRLGRIYHPTIEHPG